MVLDNLISQIDKAYESHDLEKADLLYKEAINQAVSLNDSGSLLQLLNDYIGLLREMCRYDEGFEVAKQIKQLLQMMELEGSIPYATSLLNIATLLRAGGMLNESLNEYLNVEKIYASSLPENSMLLAGFYNNKSLLHQEMGDLGSSVNCLNKALSIALSNNASFEIAVTYSNLANSYIGLGNLSLAKEMAEKAILTFDEINTHDSHYASSLYALGLCENSSGDPIAASAHLNKALQIVEEYIGKSEFYYRIKDELKNCESAFVSGMNIAKEYYRQCFAPVIFEKFPEYKDRIAVGLVGRGSDCYGYDDSSSIDHDWGPGLCVFVTKETYDEIGEELTKAYDELPKEFMNAKRGPVVSSHKRKGIFIIEDFYKDLLGKWPLSEIDYYDIPDYSLSASVNGQVFIDEEGIFTKYRNMLLKGYPESLLYRKIAEAASTFSQCAQYNMKRMLDRKDSVTASIMLSDGIKAALKLAHYIENKYPPHDKWLLRSASDLKSGSDLVPLIHNAMEHGKVDELGAYLALKLYEAGYTSDSDDYLDHHAEELIFKSDASLFNNEELVDKITKLEFEAFDKVKNEGGRASCQNDWYTFSIMRKSQYLTWTREMLLQYYYDFSREYRLGHNLITEKYGRMMASTAPDRYDEIKDNFPEITDEKRSIIEAVVSIQVNWIEEFSSQYPKLGNRARSIHSYDDNLYNTSYETYLRGEIETYSDKMLELYGRFVASLAKNGENLAFKIMETSVHLYGYSDLKSAEEKAR